MVSWLTECTFHSPVGIFRQRAELFCSPFNQTYHITFFRKKKTSFFNCSSGHVERGFDSPIKDPLPWFPYFFRSTSEEIFVKSFFQKKKHSGFISGQIDFFWQPWQVVPAKRPNSFPLRPDNIIFLCQSYSEKINWKGRKQFWQPFHIRFTRMSGKLSLKIWKM